VRHDSHKQEIVMNTQVGLWIDHKQATIVALTEQGEAISEILSDAETQLRRSGDSPLKGSYEALQVPADDSRQRALTGELNTYYDAVIGQIRDADSILIVGPGAAKYELQKRLEEKRLGAKVVGVETVDLLTEPQLAAKIRQHFAHTTAR
jgi:stalled ribosome rescue protein Dom34